MHAPGGGRGTLPRRPGGPVLHCFSLHLGRTPSLFLAAGNRQDGVRVCVCVFVCVRLCCKSAVVCAVSVCVWPVAWCVCVCVGGLGAYVCKWGVCASVAHDARPRVCGWIAGVCVPGSHPWPSRLTDTPAAGELGALPGGLAPRSAPGTWQRGWCALLSRAAAGVGGVGAGHHREVGAACPRVSQAAAGPQKKRPLVVCAGRLDAHSE